MRGEEDRTTDTNAAAVSTPADNEEETAVVGGRLPSLS